MPPETLFRYIIARALTAIGALYLMLASLIFLIDVIENLRFAGKYDAAGPGLAAAITLLRTPSLVQALTPFIFLFASIWTFTQLNRRSEIAVMRSAGLSVWRLIGPQALLAAVFGLLLVFFIDPLAARLASQADAMRDAVRGKSSSLVRVLGDGIWLRQRAPNSVVIIRADTYDPAERALENVTVWRLGLDHAFRERIDAPAALLRDSTLEMREAAVKTTDARFDQQAPLYAFATSLSPRDFTERVEPPETMAIWRLPRFAALAEAAGLPTVRYHLRFHELCSTPLKLIVMVLIAALCALRPWRSGAGFSLALMSIGAGFALYVLSELFVALGESGVAPLALAAWSPTLIAALVACAGLLQVEDG
ncbi:MAG: LPS export ABC transporter permease LptG [Pseudomonadota bacterium]